MRTLRRCAFTVALVFFAQMSTPLAGPAQFPTEVSPSKRWLDAAPPVPSLARPANLAEWEKSRLDVRKTVWSLLGELPPRPQKPEVRTLSREDRGEYAVEKFEFDNGAGAIVPGYVLLPKTASSTNKAPGVLYCHWHGGEYAIGKEELFQAKHTPEEPGPALARKGFVVLGIDAYCFGERNGKGPGGTQELGGAGEMSASKFNLWLGRTLWGMILRDDLIALDILAARPEVNAGQLSVTGISMGATRTWWLMALDERLKAGVAVACMTRYQDLIQAGALSAHGIYYFVPGMLRRFDTEAVIALIAPRPILFMTGGQDIGSPVPGIRRIEEDVRPIYRLYGQEPMFQSIVYPDLGHVYTQEMWNRTLTWLDDHGR